MEDKSDEEDEMEYGNPNSLEFGNEPSKKTRKPYTVSKQRENWNQEEHQKFLEALKLFDRDWKQIEKFIGTKNVIQIRSHAQKYFSKIQKNHTGERIPPPRPKKKQSSTSTPPTPQTKVSADQVISIPWIVTPTTSSPTLGISTNILTTSTTVTSPNPNIPMTSTSSPSAFIGWMVKNGLLPNGANSSMTPTEVSDLQRKQQEQLLQAQANFQQSIQRLKSTKDPQGPNYAKIYSFLGSLFDPSVTNHIEGFNELSSVDKETIQMLLQNLTTNVSNRAFIEQHADIVQKYQNLFANMRREKTG